jgi:hypothetical protein
MVKLTKDNHHGQADIKHLDSYSKDDNHISKNVLANAE